MRRRKREPRLGERYEEPIAAYEQPLAPGRDVAAADRALADWPDDAPVADFLLSHPAHRHSVRRIQNAAPYSEIRDNTIAKDFVAIDMLRAKLSFFGATRFDPRSDRWVRICMFAGAPSPPIYVPPPPIAGFTPTAPCEPRALIEHSFSEVMALARARRAVSATPGAPPEDAATAVQWLHRQGLDGVTAWLIC